MHLWVDVKYVHFLKSRLERFSHKGGNLFNFRCPLCNDSQKNKRKARGYIYEFEGKLKYHCHNCGIDVHFKNFLKQIDPRLYAEYRTENLLNKNQTKIIEPIEEKKPYFPEAAYEHLLRFKRISDLDTNHPAKQYVTKRQIPAEMFRWVPNFMHWTNILVPNKFEEKVLKYDTGRIVIPFYDRDKRFFAYQGRSLDKDGVRYISICLDEKIPMLFGMEKVNFNQDIFGLEGPLDSLFINNSVAIAGSNFSALTQSVPRARLIMVWDNESANKDTIKKIHHSIECGLRVVIWPDNIQEKDINAMILAGMSKDHIQYVIENNTYSGLKAKIHLNSWARA